MLGNWQINDFLTQTQQVPMAEYHLTGQSLFDDKFTFYSDTLVGNIRQRIATDEPLGISGEDYMLASSRHELDMPMQFGGFKLVPYTAGTFGYDNRSGFARGIATGTGAAFGEKDVYIGELGIRASLTPFWKDCPDVNSQLWDLDTLRHTIKPGLVASIFGENDSAVEQKNFVNLSLSQRLQTKRGKPGEKELIDWMRLDVDATWVNDSENLERADKFIFSKPFVPLAAFSAPEIFNSDLSTFKGGVTTFETFGMQRNSINADYSWRISDTSAILSDLNYDMLNGEIEQFNVGFAQMRWPNLSYYIGSRYIKNVNVLGEKGSNALTFAATYKLDPRYTLVFAQQFDFDYGINMRSDITLLRRYHRLYYGFTFSADQSLDREAIVFSIWPQGVKELAVGSRRYVGLGMSSFD